MDQTEQTEPASKKSKTTESQSPPTLTNAADASSDWERDVNGLFGTLEDLVRRQPASRRQVVEEQLAALRSSMIALFAKALAPAPPQPIATPAPANDQAPSPVQDEKLMAKKRAYWVTVERDPLIERKRQRLPIMTEEHNIMEALLVCEKFGSGKKPILRDSLLLVLF